MEHPATAAFAALAAALPAICWTIGFISAFASAERTKAALVTILGGIANLFLLVVHVTLLTLSMLGAL